MDDHTRLPASLAPWAPTLSTLTVGVALALGPLVKQLDELLAGPDGADATGGQPDGYAGLAGRGGLDRLLTSQLLLAQEVPDEFVRRAATGELLYLAPAYRANAPRGRIAVLVDTGPAQLGAARLAQLAALMVLHRRATAQGRSLVVGVLGEPPGDWRTGDLRAQLAAWLSARRAVEPSAAAARDWLARVDAADEAWLLTGPALAAELADHTRVLVSQERDWGADGATTLHVRVRDRQTDLRLPEAGIGLRVLRGAAFQRPSVRTGAGTGPLRAPQFSSARAQLLARGEDASTILSAGVPTGRPRTHQLPDPVLGASWWGRRLVVLTCAGQTLRTVVIGKPMGGLHELAVPLADIGVSAEDVRAAADGPLSPVYQQGEDVLCEIAGAWWRLSAARPPRRESSLVSILAGEQGDRRRTAWRSGTRTVVDGVPGGTPVPADATVVFGPRGCAAWSVDATTWRVYTPNGIAGDATVPDRDSVAGLVNLDGPHLLTLSSGGLIARLVSPARSRTLTRWSGGVGRPALHPTRPWLAVPRPDGLIEVADLAANKLLCTVRGDP